MEGSPENDRLISVTESPGWTCLQTLRACVSGRLGRFSRGRKPQSRPKKRGNDAVLIEMDLDPILRGTASVADITREAFDEMDHTALNLLRSLDIMANLQLIPDEQGLTGRSDNPELSNSGYEELTGLKASVDKVARLGADFERLCTLLNFLISLPACHDEREFSIATGTNPLFLLPPGDAGDLAIGRLRKWNEILKTLCGRPQALDECSLVSPEVTAELPGQTDTLDESCGDRVSTVVEAIFKEFRQLSCVKNSTHEIRLHISDAICTERADNQQNLDMFISCCPGSNLIWQDARCGDFPVQDVAKKCICDSIKRAMHGRRKLHILVKSEGLYDVTERLPFVPLPCDSFDGTSLSELLEQDVFGPIDSRAYLDNTAQRKVNSATKAQVALGLSRCLMYFFDKGLELASHSWIAENVHFREVPGNDKEGAQRLLYVSLRPSLNQAPGSDVAKMFNSGNPVVLSFAKLLLEVLDGKAIEIQINPQDDHNFTRWSDLGDVVERMLGDRARDPFASEYLEVVQGALSLWANLQNFENRTDLLATRRFVRKAIFERIVQKLGLLASSEQAGQAGSGVTSSQERRKRKSRGPIIDDRSAKRLSFSPRIPAVRRSPGLVNGHGPGRAASQSGEGTADKEEALECTEEDTDVHGRSSLYDEQAEINPEDRRTAKAYLSDLDDSFRRYIQPLKDYERDERNPIKVAIIDSGIDLHDPLIRARRCQIGEMRNWTDNRHDDCADECGHGTHITRLILGVAPAVQVYIAKVSRGKKLDTNVAGQIAQAIEWATGVWKVDIISMSLAMDGEDSTIRKALDKVLDPPHNNQRKVMAMAAASNWGGNRQIAFPACHEDVICVHSTDGHGNPSKTNPTPRKGKDFAVLGMSIKSSLKGKDRRRVEKYISGTSYATAIAAGVAANVLEFSKRDPKLWDDEKGWLHSSWGMSRVFKRMSEERGGYRYVMPWRVFDERRSEEEIWREIRRALKEHI